MKRKNNIYTHIYELKNILYCCNKVCEKIRNRNTSINLKSYICSYATSIKYIIQNISYIVGPYTHFTIYEPKKREIVNLGIIDKILSNLIARYILYPAISPCLLDINVASRKEMGTNKGLELRKKFNNICKNKYTTYYILKCDISKFFASIDHHILKQKLLKRIKDKNAIKIVFDVIDSNAQGLYIGSMISQVLAIFYLNDLDHYIKEILKIKYYVRYQDDFLLFHPSKKYLKYCLYKIKEFLTKEKLVLNNKTRIYKSSSNFIFLGRTQNNKYSRYRNVKKKLKKIYTQYVDGKISLNSFCSSIINYKKLCKRNKLDYK